jgi:alpha-L-rhamnosidase
MLMRKMVDKKPLFMAPWDPGNPWQQGKWPGAWIRCPGSGESPFVTAYRLRFKAGIAGVARIHVTADERYELFLDGARIGRGPERGDPLMWFYETHDLHLKPGRHILVARVWSLGHRAPYAQLTFEPGFALAAEGAWQDVLTTGIARWEAKVLDGYRFTAPESAWGTGWNLDVDGAAFPWGFERGLGSGWEAADGGDETEKRWRVPRTGDMANERPRGHLLFPAMLPAMMEETRRIGRVRHAAPCEGETRTTPVLAAQSDSRLVEALQQMVRDDRVLVIPPHRRLRVVVDLDDYYCAYPEIVVSGGKGSSIRLHWAESLFADPKTRDKGHRDEIEGKLFAGIGDIFRPDGGRHRHFDTLWWQAGRYVELLVGTGSEPLRMEALRFRETRYPYRRDTKITLSDKPLADSIPIMLRGLEMCSHETYMDCPYYEQLMYVGDTRLEVLATYTLTRDDRLPRKALRLFDASCLPSGWTQSRYPSRITQIIPPFSFWHVAMVHDHALWRGNFEFIRALLPGVRGILDAALRGVDERGLMRSPVGWDFVDWTGPVKGRHAWLHGVPPGGFDGFSAILNWHLALTLVCAAEIEDWAGEPELAARNRRRAREIAAAAQKTFWQDDRGLFSDTEDGCSFSEHAQCLALLSGLLSVAQEKRNLTGLERDPDLVRATIYFRHYLLEVFARFGRMDAFFDRLDLWRDLKARGFKTPFEMPGHTRSDCHAWSSHPFYHFYASVLGVRPASPGFEQVEVRPQLGPLPWARGRLVHPRGWIEVDARQEDGRLQGSITLPSGVRGTLVTTGGSRTLKPGRQRI